MSCPASVIHFLRRTGAPTALLVLCLFAGRPLVAAQNVSALAEPPDWRCLDSYRETITHDEFQALLEKLYAPHGGWEPWIRLDADAAVIRTSHLPLNDLYTLPFASDTDHAKPLPDACWKPRADIPPPQPPADQPLAGVRVALDPGHLGGRWARLEERWFQIGDSPPVMEGEMTLRVAHLLADRLRRLGAARVDLVRAGDEPLTSQRPADLTDEARRLLADGGILQPRLTNDGPADPQRQLSLSWMSDMLFTRADIRARGRRVNEVLRPDVVICLHLNAEAWGDPAHPALVAKNHLHLLVNGCYSADELAKDDVRLEMLRKLLDRSAREEVPLADAVAAKLAAATGLPPYEYTGANAIRVGESPYVWARNLLANRLYTCPVIYAEPYVMNSPEVFARVQAGDYEGWREIDGVSRKSLFREYADAVADGLADYYRVRPHP